MNFSMFAASVHGQKYRERGLPCQDSSSTMEFDGVQAIAVADGHGGKDYFRSDKGARLAVEVLFDRIKIFCRDLDADERFSDAGIRNFLFAIRNGWRDAVLRDWRENPPSPRELRWKNVSDKYKARFTSADENILAQYVPVAYGTTLLGAISIGSQVLLIQIGDGTCVVLQQNGEFKVPVPTDSENFFNVTTSLCEADAVTKFRHAVLNCDDSPRAPVAIFLSTDGLDDCYPIFENDKWLSKLYAGTIIDSLIENGPSLTREALRDDLLPYLTERGSNDDISLAYLVTGDANLLLRTMEKFHALATAQAESPPTTQSPQKFSTPQPTGQSPQKFSTPQPTGQSPQKFSTPPPTGQSPQKFSTPPPTVKSPQKFSTPQPTGQSPQKFSTGQPTGQSPQKFSTPPPTGQSPQKFSTPPPTGQSPQKFSTGQPTTQSPQKFSTGQPTGQSSQKFSTPPPTGQSPQKFSTLQPTTQSSQKFSTPPPTGQSPQKFSTPSPPAQSPQKFSTPPPTGQSPQKFSTPPPTVQVSQKIIRHSSPTDSVTQIVSEVTIVVKEIPPTLAEQTAVAREKLLARYKTDKGDKS